MPTLLNDDDWKEKNNKKTKYCKTEKLSILQLSNNITTPKFGSILMHKYMSKCQLSCMEEICRSNFLSTVICSLVFRGAAAWFTVKMGCLNNNLRSVCQEVLSGHPTLSPYNFYTNSYFTK